MPLYSSDGFIYGLELGLLSPFIYRTWLSSLSPFLTFFRCFQSLGHVSGEETKIVMNLLTRLSIFGVKAPQERMQELVDIVKGQADLDAKLNISDADHVDRGKRPANGAGNDVGAKKARVQSHQVVNKGFEGICY